MIKELLRNPKTFATPVVLFLVSDMGSDVLNYEPETIRDRLREIEPEVDNDLVDRVNAALGLFTSDLFWNDPVVFGLVCRTLNRATTPLGDEPTLGDVAWGVTEASLLTEDTIDNDPSDTFSSNINKYVKYLLKIQGIYVTPETLSTAFGDISAPLLIDDPQILSARHAESSEAADDIDKMVSAKMTELLLQIKGLGIKLSAEAENDLNALLQGSIDG